MLPCLPKAATCCAKPACCWLGTKSAGDCRATKAKASCWLGAEPACCCCLLRGLPERSSRLPTKPAASSAKPSKGPSWGGGGALQPTDGGRRLGQRGSAKAGRLGRALQLAEQLHARLLGCCKLRSQLRGGHAVLRGLHVGPTHLLGADVARHVVGLLAFVPVAAQHPPRALVLEVSARDLAPRRLLSAASSAAVLVVALASSAAALLLVAATPALLVASASAVAAVATLLLLVASASAVAAVAALLLLIASASASAVAAVAALLLLVASAPASAVASAAAAPTAAPLVASPAL